MSRPAVPVATATPTTTVVVIDLPLHESCGFMVDGNPPRITQVVSDVGGDDPKHHQHLVGYYVASLQLPGLTISNIADSNRLRQLIQSNVHLARRLTLTSHPPTTAATNAAVGCLYQHDLPVGSTAELGLALHGFPPYIQSVSDRSPLAGKVHPGQTVDAVLVPGQQATHLTLQSGGFTAHRITSLLDESQKLTGRQLVVKDRADVMNTEPRGTSRGAFDAGDLLTNWFKPRKKVVTKSFGRKG